MLALILDGMHIVNAHIAFVISFLPMISRMRTKRAHLRGRLIRVCLMICVIMRRRKMHAQSAVVSVAKRKVRRADNSRMVHDMCDHEKTKNARAKWRRERRKAEKTELADDGIEIVIE